MVENNNVKQVFVLDDECFFIGTITIDVKEKQDFKYTEIEPKKGLLKPKFDGKEWIEGADKEKLMMSMLVPEFDLNIDSKDYLILKILGILKEGGMIMDNKWFFQYCMFCWAERRIEENYLEMAKKLKMLTDEQITMIKMTPRVKLDEDE